MFFSHRRKLKQLERQVEEILSVLDDLNTAVGNAVVAMDAAVAAIQAGGTNTAPIQTAIDTLNAASAALSAVLPKP